MSGPVYATRADLVKFGMPRGLLANPSRSLGSVSVAGDTLTLDDHGLETDEPIVFRAEEDGSMPAPLVEGVTYYAQPQTSATFKVAAAVAGPAINLTTEGSRVLVISPLPIDDVLELYSRWVDGVLVAHGTPLEADDDLAYPIEIVAAVATLAGARLLWISGQRSIALGEIEMQAKAQLERWSKGVPVREIQSSEPRTNLAIASTVRVLPRYWVPVDYTEDYLP